MDFSITFLFQTMKLEALGLGSTKNGEHTLMVAISLTDSGDYLVIQTSHVSPVFFSLDGVYTIFDCRFIGGFTHHR